LRTNNATRGYLLLTRWCLHQIPSQWNDNG